MKRYVPIVIGVVALCVVLFVANSQITKHRASGMSDEKAPVVTSFNGQVMRNFEGENLLDYGFDLPEGATTTLEKDGALVKVSSASSTPLLEMYFSYEGGRGYSPADYITNIIVPNVHAVTLQEPVTIGIHEWNTVESERSIWHIATSDNGKWLVVVENRKADNEIVEPVLESIITK